MASAEHRRIPLLEPRLGVDALSYLEECVRTNFVSSVGPFVDRFEEAFAARVGAPYAVACSSGTAALHVALRLAGADRGTEVAVSTCTFIASANAISYCGASPLLVDSERRTWNLDPALLVDEIDRRARIGRRLPAVIEVVHVLGHPAEIGPILELGERYGIAIVEDAAESLGATYSSGRLAGRHVGTLGDLGCFSFNGNKVLTTGGGGMIVTGDPKLANRARHLTTQAKLPGHDYLHDEVGYNYRLTNVAAALGLSQLDSLSENLACKRAIAGRYRDGLAGIDGLNVAPVVEGVSPSFWLSSILLPSSEIQRRVMTELADKGVETRPVWKPVHRQPPYAGYARLGGEVADDLNARGLSLPSSPHLTCQEQSRVIQAIRSVLR